MESQKIIHGEHLIVYAGGKALAASKTCTLSIDASLLKTSSPQDGQWEHSTAGRKSWSVSTNCLLASEVYDGMLSGCAYGYTGIGSTEASWLELNGRRLTTALRGLNLHYFDAGDGYWVVDSWKNYDTYGDLSKCGMLINELESLHPISQLAGIVSYDAFAMTQELAAAIHELLGVPLDVLTGAVGNGGGHRGALVCLGAINNHQGVGIYRDGTGSVGSTRLLMQGGVPLTGTPLKDAAGRVGELFDLRMQVDGLPGDYLTGQAYCKSFKVTATKGQLLQGAFTWEGSGPLE